MADWTSGKEIKQKNYLTIKVYSQVSFPLHFRTQIIGTL